MPAYVASIDTYILACMYAFMRTCMRPNASASAWAFACIPVGSCRRRRRDDEDDDDSDNSSEPKDGSDEDDDKAMSRYP